MSHRTTTPSVAFINSIRAAIPATLLTMTLPFVIGQGCGLSPEPPRPSGPEPTIPEYSGGLLRVPGASILTGGQWSSGNAGVRWDSLAGVQKGDQIYLYHPALGNVELSEETSRRAVGAFLVELASEGDEQNAISKAPRDLKSLVIGESTLLSTGVTMKRIGERIYEATNPKRRWVAIKPSLNQRPVFIAPRRSFGIVSVYDWSELLSADMSTAQVAQFTLEEMHGIETFGAISRALLSPMLLPSMVSKAAPACASDSLLFARLNALDYEQFMVDGLFKVLGVAPVPGSECVDLAARQLLVQGFEGPALQLLTGDQQLASQYYERVAADFAQQAGQCLCEAMTGPACKTVNLFLGIMAAGSWIIDERLLGTWDVLTNDAYAKLSVDPPSSLTAAAAADHPSVLPGQSTTLRASTSGGTPPYYYYWGWASGPLGTQVTFERPKYADCPVSFYVGTPPGEVIFNLLVVDSNNATTSANVTVRVAGDPGNIVATPSFDPDGGSFSGTVNVTISGQTPGASIRYTTNGSMPTRTEGTLISSGSSVSLTATTTLAAIAYKDGMADSSVRTATYTTTSSGTVSTPTFSPDGGTFTGSQNVTISCATTGAAIRYTTDGSTPSRTSGTIISSGSSVNVTSTTTLKAIAYKDGMTDSAVKSATYSMTVDPGGETLIITLPGGVPLELVRIPAGTFQMGDISGVGMSAERPVHTVTISQPFYLGRYEVTQAQWRAVMVSRLWRFAGDSRPVETVSWNHCQDFCAAVLTQTGYAIRLPTEAEWEYACRAGTTTDYYFGNDAEQLGQYAWYWSNTSSEMTHDVGGKLPNAWGLYDMHGNVWEWCQDWSGAYSADAQLDPLGPSSGTLGVLRGGSWYRTGYYCRSARRYSDARTSYRDDFGLRVAVGGSGHGQ